MKNDDYWVNGTTPKRKPFDYDDRTFYKTPDHSKAVYSVKHPIDLILDSYSLKAGVLEKGCPRVVYNNIDDEKPIALIKLGITMATDKCVAIIIYKNHIPYVIMSYESYNLCVCIATDLEKIYNLSLPVVIKKCLSL